MILTHVDDDHIGGILKWLSNNPGDHKIIGKVWFNSGRLIAEYFSEAEIEDRLLDLDLADNGDIDTSIRQGVKFENYIETHGIWERSLILADKVREEAGVRFYILSPNEDKLQLLQMKWEKETPSSDTAGGLNDYGNTVKQLLQKDNFTEDTATHNGSSIAFLMSYKSQNFLFLADAHPSVLIESLKNLGFSKDNPVPAVLVKVAHHGSKSNMCTSLFEMIQSKNFVISTNGDRHGHPDKQLLARIIGQHPDATVYFNYPNLINEVFCKEDHDDYPHFRAESCEHKIFDYEH